MNKENPVYKNIETIISHVRMNMHAGILGKNPYRRS